MGVRQHINAAAGQLLVALREHPLQTVLTIIGTLALIVMGLWLLWFGSQYWLLKYAQSYAEELSIYIPLNKPLLTAVTYLIFIAFVPIATLIFRLKGRKRWYGGLFFAGFSVLFYGGLGIVSKDFRIDPITSAPEKCFIIRNGKVELTPITPGVQRQVDPYTGAPCQPVTPEIAAKIDRWELGIRPNRIADGDMPQMFDGALGTPLIWYSRSENGNLELFDNDGFHPFTSEPLQPITREVAREWQTQTAGQHRAQEEEDKKRRELAELVEREQQRVEELRRTAGKDCDRMAGNAFDRNRNVEFPGVSFQLLRANSEQAVAACQDAVENDSNTVRFRYQLARSLHASRSPHAKSAFSELARNNYPAAFDNLGWMAVSENRVTDALSYFEHGASLGSAEAMVSLAHFLSEGKWTRRDVPRAYSLLQSAAAQGHPEAITAMQKLESEQRALQMGGALLGAVLGGILKNGNR